MIYTPETISDAQERRQVPKIPSKGIVVVDATSYTADSLEKLVGELSLMFDVGLLVVGDKTEPFNPRINVQHIASGQQTFADIVKEVQPDVVITGTNYDVATFVKATPPGLARRSEAVYLSRSSSFNTQNSGVPKLRYKYAKNMTQGRGQKINVEWSGYGYKVRSTKSTKRGGEKEVGNVVRSSLKMSPWHMLTKRDEVVKPLLIHKFEDIRQTVTEQLARSRASGNYAHFAPNDVRWNGTEHTDNLNERLLGVKGVIERAQKENNLAESVQERSNSDKKDRLNGGFLAGYDVALGSIGFYAGLIGVIGGHVATEQKMIVKAATEVAAGLVVSATAIEATVKSEKIRVLAGKAKKFMASLVVIGLGLGSGMMIGGALGMGSELVNEIGAVLEHGQGLDVNPVETGPVQERGVELQPTNIEPHAEGVTSDNSEPELTWSELTAYFEQQIASNGGEVWVNDQGTPFDESDDVSQAQVMAHKALMEGGVDEAQAALSAIAETTSYIDYMTERAEGNIYSAAGN